MSPRTEIESTLPTSDSRTPDERVDGTETQKQVRPSRIWGFLNSAFGLWLLSSVLLSFAVYVFQQWQDYQHEQQSAIEKQERINVEIAGRLSQFGQWFKNHLLDKDNLTRGYAFKAIIGKDDVFTAISEFADTPQHSIPKVGAHIQEVLPEFAERNMVSLYAELRSINEKISNAHFFRRLLMFDSVIMERTKADNLLTAITPYSIKQAEYRTAMVALLDPDYLFGYHPFDHNTFVSLFEVTFFTSDIRNSKLPSTDCLEKTADCGASPNAGTTAPVATRDRSAGGEG